MSSQTNRSRPLAVRTAPFQESVIREMTRLGDETGSVNLSQGLPDYDPPPEVLAAALEAIQSGDNQYTFPFGTLQFRQAIAAKYARYNHIQVDPETDVTVTCGVTEALMAAILALTDPGDEVIIFEPWYENYLPACYMTGAIPRFVALHEPDYTFDPAELRDAFGPRTRLVIVNTPHNPTGRVFRLPELEQIAIMCQQYGALALTDEIYEYILYEGRQHVSLGSLPGMEDRTVTTSGLGKTYSLTGWRVGWMVAPPALSSLLRKVHDYLTICAPAPFQAAGVVALELPESYYVSLIEEYTARRNLFLPALDAAGLAYHPPEGAYYLMADFKDLHWDAEGYRSPEWTIDRAFSEFMARQIGVAVVPGSSFYAGSERAITRVRVNFAKRLSTLEEAAHRLERLRKPA